MVWKLRSARNHSCSRCGRCLRGCGIDLTFGLFHRGRRLRPEAQEELLESLEEARQGKGLSPAFTNTEDAIKWLRRDV